MPFVTVRGVELQYAVIGDRGPWVAAVSSARFSHVDMLPLASAIAARGRRVLVHDRRNTGQSALSFDFAESEDEVWADDLRALIDLLGIEDVLVTGLSRGARVAAQFALRHRRVTRSAVLWGLAGGLDAFEYLDEYYFGQYLRTCEGGGMDAVCAIDHFLGVLPARPENEAVLRTMPPERFLAVMQQWRASYGDRAHVAVLGLPDEVLGSIRVPVGIVPYYDRLHPVSASEHAARSIRRGVLLDFDPSRRSDVRRSTDDLDVVAGLIAAFDERRRARWWRRSRRR
jgi:pimeloyl-ACP methyl ester carboxylesterase